MGMTTGDMPHDASYKALFSNPDMVRSLLLDFIPESFISGFDFDTLEHCAGSYASDDLRERHNDIVWRLRWKDTWCYIYIMVEFQSSQHHWMALRILTYTALLWEELVKTGVVKTGDKLPPVFPIVLYNGDDPWKAPAELADLVMPLHPDLDAYQPRHRYRVLDEKRVPEEAIRNAAGEAAYVMRVEQAKAWDEIFGIAVDFEARVNGEDFASTRMAMIEWIERKMRHSGFPDQENGLFGPKEESMLAELIEKYKKPYIEQGFALGHAEGEAIGLERGEAIGLAQGETKGLRRILKDMLADRFGEIPASWEMRISDLNEPEILTKLTRSVYRVDSPDEFAELLNQYRPLS